MSLFDRMTALQETRRPPRAAPGPRHKPADSGVSHAVLQGLKARPTPPRHPTLQRNLSHLVHKAVEPKYPRLAKFLNWLRAEQAERAGLQEGYNTAMFGSERHRAPASGDSSAGFHSSSGTHAALTALKSRPAPSLVHTGLQKRLGRLVKAAVTPERRRLDQDADGAPAEPGFSRATGLQESRGHDQRAWRTGRAPHKAAKIDWKRSQDLKKTAALLGAPRASQLPKVEPPKTSTPETAAPKTESAMSLFDRVVGSDLQEASRSKWQRRAAAGVPGAKRRSQHKQHGGLVRLGVSPETLHRERSPDPRVSASQLKAHQTAQARSKESEAAHQAAAFKRADTAGGASGPATQRLGKHGIMAVVHHGKVPLPEDTAPAAWDATYAQIQEGLQRTKRRVYSKTAEDKSHKFAYMQQKTAERRGDERHSFDEPKEMKAVRLDYHSARRGVKKPQHKFHSDLLPGGAIVGSGAHAATPKTIAGRLADAAARRMS